jgi:hypothetical protein
MPNGSAYAAEAPGASLGAAPDAMAPMPHNLPPGAEVKVNVDRRIESQMGDATMRTDVSKTFEAKPQDNGVEIKANLDKTTVDKTDDTVMKTDVSKTFEVKPADAHPEIKATIDKTTVDKTDSTVMKTDLSKTTEVKPNSDGTFEIRTQLSKTTVDKTDAGDTTTTLQVDCRKTVDAMGNVIDSRSDVQTKTDTNVQNPDEAAN